MAEQAAGTGASETDGQMQSLISKEGVEAAPLSRKAQKRLAKQQILKETMKQKRIAKKQVRKAESLKRKEETAAFVSQLTEDERAKLRQESKERREKRKEEAAKRKHKLNQALTSGQGVIVDLDFDAKMTEKEVKSLCQQIAYSYSANTKAEHPVHLHFTSLCGRIRDSLNVHASGFSGWTASLHEESFEVLFAERRQDLVYLTADAQNTLEALDAQKIYVIGGLVDRNRYKGLCQAKAKSLGVDTAKLPLEEHIKMAGTRVLTVNQVLEIMLNWLAMNNWAEAVQASVPARKQAKPEGEEKGQDGESDA